MKMRFTSKILFTAILCSSIFYGCRKPEKYPPEPFIEFVSFDTFGEDSAIIKLNFTDGDGDIGLDPKDTNPPFNTGSEYEFNAYITYYYQNPSGAFVPFDIIDTVANNYVKWTYRLPVITPEGKDKSLHGEMYFKLDEPYHIHDTVKYEVYIYDRALHKSNVISTPAIIF